MKKLIIYSIFLLIIIGCRSEIKNKETKIQIEKGTEITKQLKGVVKKNNKKETKKTVDEILGLWVGYFEKDIDDYTKNIYVDVRFMWNRENKITISIDEITDSLIIGHSVVAGNSRPFKGIVKNDTFVVREPGDDKYDGEFIFSIIEDKLIGKWKAYKKIDIQNRKYSLERKEFKYNPDILLEKTKEYVNWNKFTEVKENVVEIEEGEFEEWINLEFATATDKIYKINASNKLLEKSDVENLKKGDLTIIRNTIYARHGYSFKNRPLRVFFDAQSWYIPIHTDIKKEFTDIEKENIQLLLRYEKNALEYYDHFGRGG